MGTKEWQLQEKVDVCFFGGQNTLWSLPHSIGETCIRISRAIQQDSIHQHWLPIAALQSPLAGTSLLHWEAQLPFHKHFHRSTFAFKMPTVSVSAIQTQHPQIRHLMGREFYKALKKPKDIWKGRCKFRMSLSISSAKNYSILRYLSLVFPLMFFPPSLHSFKKVSCLVIRKKKWKNLFCKA